MDKIQGVHEIFDIHSHTFITRRKLIEFPIPKTITKHIEEMAAQEKSVSLKFNNIAGVIYYNDWTAGVEYEDTEYKKEPDSEEYQQDEDFTESENYESKDQDKYLEAEEDINEGELE